MQLLLLAGQIIYNFIFKVIYKKTKSESIYRIIVAKNDFLETEQKPRHGFVTLLASDVNKKVASNDNQQKLYLSSLKHAV